GLVVRLPTLLGIGEGELHRQKGVGWSRWNLAPWVEPEAILFDRSEGRLYLRTPALVRRIVVQALRRQGQYHFLQPARSVVHQRKEDFTSGLDRRRSNLIRFCIVVVHEEDRRP